MTPRPDLPQGLEHIVREHGRRLGGLERTKRGSPFPASAFAAQTVDTAASTTSTSFTTISGGPSVNVAVSDAGILVVGLSGALKLNSGAGNAAVMAYDLSGPATQGPADDLGIRNDALTWIQASFVDVIIGLPAGTYTVAARYKSIDGLTSFFANRRIWALALAL